jgi:hypothetical protein
MKTKILDLQKIKYSKNGKNNSYISIACTNGSTLSLFACPGNSK